MDLQKVMNDYGEYCIRVAYLYVKDWAAAEEIVQDVFLAYYNNHSRFEGKSTLKTYLVKITVHKSHDYLRSWRAKKRRLLQPFQMTTTAPSIERQAVLAHEKSELIEALLELAMHYREVLILYYYEELKIRDIAALLECSENTVKTRLKRGREQLKEKLETSEWEVLLHE
ncbi:sigma-70 family RNA polymerase sigma factor [Solibacillus sp. CAU 1738]|uniref:sigma-70 family RNA polymerase sigma factor n=1 Tax=Solibacillus sp. CAU 1738 TaxID=3140363 RepID=UPI00325FF70A